MSTLEILRAARARLSDPKNWNGGADLSSGGGCVGLTLSRAGDRESRFSAQHALARVLGLEECVWNIHRWNDDPKTTHADVLAALDTAIAAEEAKVAA